MLVRVRDKQTLSRALKHVLECAKTSLGTAVFVKISWGSMPPDPHRKSYIIYYNEPATKAAYGGVCFTYKLIKKI